MSQNDKFIITAIIGFLLSIVTMPIIMYYVNSSTDIEEKSVVDKKSLTEFDY